MSFLPHNSHLEGPDSFEERDPHLRLLRERPLIYRSEFLDLLPRRQAGIYTVSGGRQIGKTTLLKQWMAKHLQDGMIPNSIVYMTGELIDDHHSLVRLLTEIIQNTMWQNIILSHRLHLLPTAIGFEETFSKGESRKII